MHVKKNNFIFFSILSIVCFQLACEHDEIDNPALSENSNSDLCDSSQVYFQNDILPVFTSNCAFSGCHDAGTATNGLILTSYENIIQSGVIEAGKPDSSELFRRITETDPAERMPLGAAPLPPQLIEDIRQWILEGAENSSCEEKTNCENINSSYSKAILPIIQRKCLGCHSANRPGGGINFSSFEGVQEAAQNLSILNAVLHAPSFKAMPLGGEPLPPCEIEAIRIWTNQGAPNN